MRQWVFSLPRWARFLLACDPALILGHLGLPITGPPTAPARLPAPAEASLWQDDVPELQRAT